MDLGCLETLMSLLTLYPEQHNNQIPLIPELVISAFIQQILAGVDYLHDRKNQLHRDLKPGNILVNSAGDAKISDFGIAKQWDSEEFSEAYDKYFKLSAMQT
jgi:serine/threonine protein kinase